MPAGSAQYGQYLRLDSHTESNYLINEYAFVGSKSAAVCENTFLFHWQLERII